jgi:site-specific DNA recombinase
VSAATWDTVQEKLAQRQRWAERNGKRDYLLRGLIRCAACGRVYTGGFDRAGRNYTCNGKRRAVSMYGHALAALHRCRRSTRLSADWLEGEVWRDIEQYLRNPGEALALLAERMRGQADQADALRAQIAHVQRQQQDKQSEKDSVIALFRRGRISERDLDRQLDDIQREDADLAREMEHLVALAAQARDIEQRLSGAEALLRRLSAHLDTPLVPATKRIIIETLVSAMTVEVDERAPDTRIGVRTPFQVHVVYCFDDPASLTGSAPAGTRTIVSSSRPPTRNTT